ncbi:hypothetical protein N7471_010344 [Penicillium samsonianum]|uniref:uncharacterized protein n=1 Tax=Penicillium samsonianum TaxID=1882272 RepID=UPI0025486032|nr:uncharacterized protein N7471_010344 [Penicillium samsonianum]KAJ6125851.1 hypothetical protein N7471_010344 [Penicillium samsonianum]
MASKLTALAGGATIWLKREDLNDYGSRKTRNMLSQPLIARRMGRTEIVTDCPSAKHGNFTTAMCARLGLRCVVVMGADEALAQEQEVFKMMMLGARLLTTRTPLAWIYCVLQLQKRSDSRFETTKSSTTVGPSPLPTLTRTFQAILGDAVATQMQTSAGCHPDAVGSGSERWEFSGHFCNVPQFGSLWLKRLKRPPYQTVN